MFGKGLRAKLGTVFLFPEQRKYEDVSKERDKVSSLAKNLKEQLNKATTASKEEHTEKVQYLIFFAASA